MIFALRFNAVLTITGAIPGTSQTKLYNRELGARARVT